MTKPESELTKKEKQVKKHLTTSKRFPTELSDEDKKMIKEKYQGRSVVRKPFVPHLVCIEGKKGLTEKCKADGCGHAHLHTC